jgi:hypothetical protein
VLLLGYGLDELLTIENLNNSPTSFLTKEWKNEHLRMFTGLQSWHSTSKKIN